MIREVETSHGPARVTLTRPDRARSPGPSRGLVLLGHSAGGGIDAPDLQAVAAALIGVEVAVGLVEQPYRVAGRRGAVRAPVLDEAMLAVVAAVRVGDEALVLGGRSSGARVACRTAEAAGAVGVLALAFPLRPPWRPEATRLPELLGCGAPVLVVQGERDRFGGHEQIAEALGTAEPARDDLTLLPVPGADHGLHRPLDLGTIRTWILERLATGGSRPPEHVGVSPPP